MLKKIIKIAFVAVLIAGLLLGINQIFHVNTVSTDPLNEILKKDNYPFNGYYNADAISLSETDLKEKLMNINGIKSHVDDLEIHVISKDSINVSAKLKEIDQLLKSQKELSSYSTWAKTFEGQKATAVFAIQKGKNGSAEIIIKSAKIGSISIDPQLISPLIASSNTIQQLNSVSFDSIECDCGVITFSDELPKLLQ